MLLPMKQKPSRAGARRAKAPGTRSICYASIHVTLPLPLPLSLLALLLAGGCQTTPALPPPSIAPAELVRVNTAVNQQGRPCPDDLCLSDWPDATDLDRLTAWDCKAYAVAKADRLIRWGYPRTGWNMYWSPARR